MNKYLLCVISLCLIYSSGVNAQSGSAYNERVKKYVSQYFPLAIAEQRAAGVPASISLGQGILETDGGTSDLMNLANNHFGIKCTPDWQGETIMHDDETPNECFKKYKSSADSYRDHTNHLKNNPRYKSLFAISPTDYASWAVGLKKCGYATNPQYAQRLIKIIEDFKLQEYTYSALDTVNGNNYPVIAEAVKTANPTSDAMQTNSVATKTETLQPETLSVPMTHSDSSTSSVSTPDTGKVVFVNGMRAFYVSKGEVLLPYAIKYHVRYPRLLEMNDLADEPAPFSMYVYLEKKLTYGTHEDHKVEDGETLLMISQMEGLQLKKLMSLNLLNPNEEPVVGSVLELQKQATDKPEVNIIETVAHKENAIVSGTIGDPTPKGDYITINRPRPAAVADTQTVDTSAENYVPTEERSDEKPIASKPDPIKTKQQEMYESIKAIEARAKADSLARLKEALDKDVYASNTKETAPEPDPVAPKPEKPARVNEYYTIHKGETLSQIAVKNHVSEHDLLKWNAVKADKIREGQKLRIMDPEKAEKLSKAKPVKTRVNDESASTGNSDWYIVQKGENLTSVARKNNLTVKQLLSLNPDLDPDKIRSGQKLKVAGGTESAKPVAKNRREPAADAGSKYYVIQKGETLSGIARKNHITLKQLQELNDQVQPDKIRDGQKLRVKE